MRTSGFLKYENRCYISIIATLAFSMNIEDFFEMIFYCLFITHISPAFCIFLYTYISCFLYILIHIYLLSYPTFWSSEELWSFTFISLSFNLIIFLFLSLFRLSFIATTTTTTTKTKCEVNLIARNFHKSINIEIVSWLLFNVWR